GNDQGDELGTSVAIEGDYAVIGAMGDDDIGPSNGAAYILKNNSGTWGQTNKIWSTDIAQTDHFGSSVAISSSYIVVGATYVPSQSLIGAAYVFENNNGIGTQIAELTADDGVDGDKFACAVSIYGDTVVVGAHQRDDNGTTSGAAYVFTNNGTAWEQIFKLLASDGEPGDNLGISVNLSGNSVILGAYAEDEVGASGGAAYVYYLSEAPYAVDGPYDVYVNVDENASFKILAANTDSYQWQLDDGSGFLNITDNAVYSNSTTSTLQIKGATLGMDGYTYRCVLTNSQASVNSSSANLYVDNSTNHSIVIETQKILASDGDDFDEFGYSVAVSGNYAIVGAHHINSYSDESGFAYIYKKNGNTWEQVKILSPSDGAEDDEFGWSVDIYGEYAIVGAYKNSDDGDYSGSVYIFYKNNGGVDNWGQLHKFTASDADTRDYFGCDVAIADKWAIVGAYGDASGSAYLYERTNETWSFDSKIYSTTALTYNSFGKSVDIDGDFAIMRKKNDVVSIYEYDAGAWNEMQELVADDDNPSQNEYFGISVSIENGYAVVGAYHTSWSDCKGAAYVFYNNSGTWIQQAKLVANDVADGDNFGRSVAISGDTVVVGSPRNDFNGTTSGSVYVFKKKESNWVQFTKLVASDGNEGDRLGFSVALDNQSVFVGAKNREDNGTSSGAVYIYNNFDNPFVNLKEDIIKIGLKIYPNPASKYICVNLEQSNQKTYNISIYNINGKLVYRNMNYNNKSQIYLNNLNTGIYVLNAIVDEKLEKITFIVK
ncbi:MAG: T9SS type A sorting domain-containing protein, partial [Bacteroidota bacterium]|nr:T9SS type A sorting domain-containing protein [Bacteroidota bacterium]